MGNGALSNLLLAVILLGAMGLAFFLIPRIMIRRALSQVIRIFRYHHALSPDSAKTAAELGFRPQNFLDRFLKTRDYKPYALQLLMQAGVIQLTPEGKMCLSEEKLEQFLRQRKIQ